MTEREIWDKIKRMTGSEIFTAALMGNMKAESNLKANNLQNSYENRLGFTDETYTKAVDSGEYSGNQFYRDAAGYGLCQWTFWSRKQALLLFARKYNASIGDASMQIDFCIYEMQNSYKNLWEKRATFESLYDAVEAILKQYEKPADQSVKAIERRTNYAADFLDQYAELAKEPEEDIKIDPKWDKLHDLLMEAIKVLETNF